MSAQRSLAVCPKTAVFRKPKDERIISRLCRQLGERFVSIFSV